MKWLKCGSIAFLSLVFMAGAARAADDTQMFQVKNRLRLEYDDNIYESATNKTDSFKVIEEVEFLVNLNLPQTYIGLRYRPTFEWWANRSSDSTDWFHDFDLVVSHNFSSRLSINAKDTLRYADQPQVIDNGAIVRQQNNFLYNVADGSLNYLFSPKDRLQLGYRNTILRYDDNAVASTEDFDINTAGLTYRHQLEAKTVLAGDLRYENVTYRGPDRGSDSEYIGLGIEQIFSPNFLGNVRAGYQRKDFSQSGLKTASDPYTDASVTFLPSPRTRVTAGAGYSLFESDVFPFASQDRTTVYLSLAHDLTAKISLYASGSYQYSKYHADQQVQQQFPSGNEDVWQGSARASYKVSRNNWLEAGWEYISLASDFREKFDRNRFDLGWRTQL